MNSAESEKISRRKFAQIAAGSGLGLAAAVTTPQTHKQTAKRPPKNHDDTEWRRRALEAIAKFDIPTATEPGFVFRP